MPKEVVRSSSGVGVAGANSWQCPDEAWAKALGSRSTAHIPKEHGCVLNSGVQWPSQAGRGIIWQGPLWWF